MSEAAVISRRSTNDASATPAGLVLIIDDEAEIRESLQTLLELEGYEVETASTGNEGLARSGDRGPALLAKGLGSPTAAVRERAVRSLAEMPGAEATAHLRAALASPDSVVRGHAALALGARAGPSRRRGDGDRPSLAAGRLGGAVRSRSGPRPE